MHIRSIWIACKNYGILILLTYFTYLLTNFNYFRSSSSRARKKLEPTKISTGTALLYTGARKKTTVILCCTTSGLLMTMNDMAGKQFYEKTWKSYEEFDEDFKEFCAYTKHAFSAIDSQPVAYQNAKLSEANHALFTNNT